MFFSKHIVSLKDPERFFFSSKNFSSKNFKMIIYLFIGLGIDGGMDGIAEELC